MRGMRGYILKITLIDSNPLIWRKVVVPSGITFKELHIIIQFSMGWNDCYLYDFNIKEENLRITCDEEAIKEYKIYSNMKLTKRNDPHGFIANLIRIKWKLSSEVKVDEYLTKENNIEYVYDFGDYWRHEITLEEIIEDYQYEYPICIEGEGACPPEDVGGICGYENFLEIIKDKNHPEYETLKEWSDDQSYKYSFDVKRANALMSQRLEFK